MPRLRRLRRLAAPLAVLGPGLIAASAGNDAGGIATYASAGSQFRYGMLFVMLLVTAALVIVQEMAARLGAVTGSGLVALIREQFPLRLATFSVGCLLVANVGLVVSEFAGIGAAMELLGVSRLLAVPLAAIGLWGLVVFGSYRYAERLFLVLSLVFLAYPIAALLGHPDWTTAAHDTVIPNLTGTREELFLVVALIGTTITPYMQLFQAAAVVERKATPEDLRAIRADSITGSVFANVISMAIIVATAAAIGGTGPLESADAAAQALEPVVGSAAKALFAVGLLGASALAAAVVPLSTSYALAEAVGVERSVSRSFRDAVAFNSLFTAQIVIGAAIALLPGNLIRLLLAMQFLNGLVSPILLAFIVILAGRRRVLGPHANGRLHQSVASLCVVAVGALAVVATVLGLQGAFGG